MSLLEVEKQIALSIVIISDSCHLGLRCRKCDLSSDVVSFGNVYPGDFGNEEDHGVLRRVRKEHQHRRGSSKCTFQEENLYLLVSREPEISILVR